jgi:DNA repair exonuclease SbcCD ATPase subunit
MAVNQVKATLTDKQKDLEEILDRDTRIIKELRDSVDTVQDRVEVKEKQIKKLKTQQAEELLEKEELYGKNLEGLKKAYKEDEKEYKETIKDLKEEIQKVKDSKTDAEVEEKRNKEIKDLKLRIKDLEKMVEDLGKLNFFSRMFKLRSISAEVLAARKELVERQDAVNRIGTTYVKENGKYRKYNAVSEYLNSLSSQARNYYNTVTSAFSGYVRW